jgi:putative glutamine amidotransferase
MTPTPSLAAPGHAPRVWVVASHRQLGNEHGKAQAYTVIDEGGSRALCELGLQPVSYPRAPAERLPELLQSVDGVPLGGSATNVHPRHYGEAPVREGLWFDEERESVRCLWFASASSTACR